MKITLEDKEKVNYYVSYFIRSGSTLNQESLKNTQALSELKQLYLKYFNSDIRCGCNEYTKIFRRIQNLSRL